MSISSLIWCWRRLLIAIGVRGRSCRIGRLLIVVLVLRWVVLLWIAVVLIVLLMLTILLSRIVGHRCDVIIPLMLSV